MRDQKTVPEVGLEPTRSKDHQILSLARLPIPSLRLVLPGVNTAVSTDVGVYGP